MSLKDMATMGPELSANPKTKRLCRICKKVLRKDRYFTCSKHDETDYWDMEAAYGVHVERLGT